VVVCEAKAVTRTLRHKAVSGLGWSAVSQIARQVTSFVVALLLARLVGPDAYGLVGMVTIFTGFGGLFVELGLGAAVIQRRELKDEQISAAFWLNLGMGAFLAGVVALAAPLMARFYHEPQLTSIAQVSALTFVFAALGTVQSALLSREMRFGALSKIDIVSSVLSGIVGLALALHGFGAWSLVGQSLSLTVFRTAGLWRSSNWLPQRAFRLGPIRDFASFSGYLFGFNVFNYWVRNADQMLIGRFVGSQALGLYSRAYQLMTFPVYQISGFAGTVMFPVLAGVQGDKARVRSIYLRSIGTLHLIAAPVYAGLMAVADTFVAAVLGERWMGLVPILRILCTVGFFQPVGNSTGWLYTALGRTDLMFRWGVLTGVFYVAGFVFAMGWGVLGVTWSYCITSWLCWYPGWSIVGRCAGLSFTQMLQPLLPASACAAAMGLAVWLVGLNLPPTIPFWMALAIQVMSGAAIYGGLVLVLRIKSGQEVMALVRERLSPAAWQSPPPRVL